MGDEKKANEETLDGQFSVQKIYVKDISFETTNTTDAFKMEWKPVVDMHITNEATPLGDDLFEGVLSVTLPVNVILPLEAPDVASAIPLAVSKQNHPSLEAELVLLFIITARAPVVNPQSIF